jgi:hypothetical protein
MSMPYAREDERRTTRLFQSIIEEYLKNRQAEIVIKDLLVKSEILKRDFTKRQLNILSYIQSLSFGFGKEEALIPQTQDFELCGVSKTKARQEIDKLIEMGVINFNEVENLYSINPPSKWDASYHKGYVETRSQELFILNAIDANWDIVKIKEKLETLESELNF